MRVGFAGTRKGLSAAQQTQLTMMLNRLYSPSKAGPYEPNEFHHGDGKDEHGGNNSSDLQAAAIARDLGWDVKPHPPKAQTATALLERNRVIEANAQVLIAAPESDKEELRSGTWMTVRCARKSAKPVVMLSRGDR